MRSLLFKILFWCGIGPVMILLMKRRAKVPIFLFHRVSPNWDKLTEPISPVDFDNILEFLGRFYNLIALKTLLKTDQKNLKSSACIVFDDAMLDFYDYSYPILQKHNVPTCIFVPTASISSQQSIWNYRLFGLFLNTEIKKFDLRLDGKNYHFYKDSTEYYSTIMSYHRQLLGKSYEYILSVIDEVSKQLKVDTIHDFASVCSWDQLLELKSNGVDIQSHTHTHSYLPSISKKYLETEFKVSKNLLSENMSFFSELVAYPNGGHTPQIVDIAKKYFSYGFAVGEEFVDLEKINTPSYQMIIPRFNVQDSCPEEIIFRIMGFHRLLSKLI